MPKYKISKKYILSTNVTSMPVYPKYTTQLINLANQNAGATRPCAVGQLTELMSEYLENTKTPSVEGWGKWYRKQYPDTVDDAVEKIYGQIENLRGAMKQIDKKMVRTRTEDLIYNKTFNGLFFQEAILRKISEIEGKPYRLATPEEEAMNIDGFVGKKAYQIKPDSYDHMKHEVREEIPCVMVKYRKTDKGVEFEYE